MELDSLDKKLLALLQKDGRASAKDLAEQAGMSVSPCWRRIRRLEEAGVIEKYAAVLNPRELGFHAIAYVHVSLMNHGPETIAAFDHMVQTEDRIIECSSIAGDADYVMKVVVRDPEDLEAFMMKKLLGPGLVRASRTNFVLRTVKSGPSMPLG
ncbi:Lrp/AsnC family transcriptional regulator [Peteryoungia desertarenae]|uniref:Lrp/AsnC family transcriptional regulator n=1 Tax=Peteryoungia desertarenae TaxID=1813451 RepID=A0ABX6QK82_9HYPH|nr:Lrp/AsnC family transcriptional regulator [Peteryoungia desertarenae]QLF68515.1 Lrp/AsnC family transcriptional regulator [Peteryoungia desertarenae]